MEQKNNSLSIIENVNIGAISNSLNAIKGFQKVVSSQFTKGHDFGIIPGTGNKPTMLKPGAEKILMLLGLTSEFGIEDSTRDFEKGFFQYQIKCILKKNGEIITEGLGSANTREKKYINQDPYTMDNTVLKMAKKRALVDAALLVGSLSDIFTQDIEDMGDLTIAPKKTNSTSSSGATITEAQSKRIYAICKGDKEVLEALGNKYHFKSTKEIKKSDYENICKEAEDLSNKKTDDDFFKNLGSQI